MRVVYYTNPSFLDTALSRINALSRFVKIDLLLELSPESWNSNLLDISRLKLPSGIVSADSVLYEIFLSSISSSWNDLASFHLIVHNCPKSVHPNSWKTSFQTANYIKQLQPQIIHLDDVSLRLAPVLWRINNLPIVLNIHDPQPHSSESSWKTTLGRWLTFRFVQQYIIHNRFSFDGFYRQYNIPESSVSLIPLGVLEIFRKWVKKSILEEPKTVLFFGRINPYKGLETLIDAARMISKQISDVRFIIAGRPLANYNIPQFHELSNNCLFELHLDYIPNDLVVELFQRAHLIVCPYTDATQSGVVLTAYAFRKPVVATRVGGLPEYIWDDETGFLVPPKNPKALAESIIKLLKDPVKHEMMKKNIANKCSEELSWDNIAKQTFQLYERLINSSKNVEKREQKT